MRLRRKAKVNYQYLVDSHSEQRYRLDNRMNELNTEGWEVLQVLHYSDMSGFRIVCRRALPRR